MEVNSCPGNSKNSVKHSQWNISRSLRIIQEVMVWRNVSSILLRELLRKREILLPIKLYSNFCRFYRVTLNKNAPSAMTPAEVMFARKIKTAFEKLLQNQSKPVHTNKVTRKQFKIDEKVVFFRMFQSNKSYWETDTVDKQIGKMIYIIKGSRFTHKKHLNQIRKRYSNTVENNPWEEDPMDIVFDTFAVPIPQMASKQRRSKRHREITDLVEITPHPPKYWLHMEQGYKGECYCDIPHDITAWTLSDTINSDWLDKRVKWV